MPAFQKTDFATMNEITITTDGRDVARRLDPLLALIARAQARALLWRLCEFDNLPDAIDPLQRAAERDGLIERIGQNMVQDILADAFGDHAMHHDHAHHAQAAACSVCGCSPCASRSFCRLCREADRKAAARRQLSDDPRRHGAPQSTFDALLYELRTHGISQFANPNCRRRLADLSSHQVRELIAALMRLRPKYSAITDDLLLKLGDQLDGTH
jgi:hypothetical protein